MSEKKVPVVVELLDQCGAPLGKMHFWLIEAMADAVFPDDTRVTISPAPGADARALMSLRYGRRARG